MTSASMWIGGLCFVFGVWIGIAIMALMFISREPDERPE